FLYKDFSAISKAKAKEISQKAGLHNREPQRLKFEDAQKLLSELKAAKLPNPDTECLSPIEDLLIKKGLSKAIDSRFVSTVTRDPKVTNGNPFQVEVGLIFGGDMPADQPIQVLRFANRVPLMYQQGGCLLTKALESVNWKQYGLEHPGGRGIPKGPAAILIHLASTNVQFTSEAKEALADNSEVMHELEQAMKEVGRGLRNHLKKSVQKKKAREKFELVNIILPEIHDKAIAILNEEPVPLAPVITKIMNAVFLEEKVEWESETKVTRVTIEMYNYTARPRAYSLLSTWPEREGVVMVDNPLGGRREAKGLWNWKLATLDPGCSTTVSFTVSGLAKGDWTEIDIFFRGAGDIIGATKLDEAILAEMLREEEASVEPEEVMEIVPTEVNEVEVRVEVTSEVSHEVPTEVSPDIVIREEIKPPAEPDEGWFGVGRGEEE
ncbi:MAG: DNA topoisomerase VI subunit B, partial [Candidatus Thermoplasmatota archaeon]|nr:DNA topoisomerase VI subunit B [Candidatus Thermoplasmatota archaeon]